MRDALGPVAEQNVTPVTCKQLHFPNYVPKMSGLNFRMNKYRGNVMLEVTRDGMLCLRTKHVI